MKHLAMFKADVDNLGLLFSSSIENVTLPLYKEMSALMDEFFTGYYYKRFIGTHKASDGTPYKDVIYTVFTGGDDMCVLGAWNYVMEMARDWHRAFLAFTSDNPSVTLSAGIVLFQHNEPLRSVAESAEEELDVSKDGGKNAITVFGTKMSWDDYSNALEKGIDLSNAMKDEVPEESRLSTGVVYRLLDFADRAKRCKEFMDNGVASVSPCRKYLARPCLDEEDAAVPLRYKDKRPVLRERDWLWQSALRYTAFRNIKDESVREKYCAFGVNPGEMITARIAASVTGGE